jgi:hypothetical protein
MLLMEDGPFELFSTLQDKLGQKTWIGRGFKCFLCLSFWVSLGAAALLATTWRELLLLWWGIAGANVVAWLYLRALEIERV